MARNPWKRLLNNIRLSSKYGASGASKNNPKNKKKLNTSQSTKRHELHVTWEDLKDIFENQGGKCHWLGIELDPQDIFIPYYPLAISADRLDNQIDYHKDNIVICSRFANLGRGQYGAEEFEELVEHIKREILSDYI
jgi:hypothetical protein